MAAGGPPTPYAGAPFASAPRASNSRPDASGTTPGPSGPSGGTVPVLPWRPAHGWREADLGRRGFAVLLAPLVLAVAALAYLGPAAPPDRTGVGETVVLWLSALLGPPACYSAARVLRPHLRDRSRHERAARHWCAATATALAGPALLLMLPLPGLEPVLGIGTGVLAGIPAAVLGVLTVGWGLVAVVVRARRPGAGP